jgi:hypothetical protein
MFEKTEIDLLLDNFNRENKTNFTFLDDSIIKFLHDKLMLIDKPSHALSHNKFIPFIKGCKQDHTLLENIKKEDIIHCDYRLFAVPTECLEKKNKKNCVIVNEGILEYIQDTFHSEKDREINREIHSYICPTSFYKK